MPSNSFSFSFHFYSSLSHSLSLLGTFQSTPLLHLLLFISSPSTPNPFPFTKSGRPRCHHSPPGDNRHKRGLGGPGCGRLTCTATGERVEESPPPLPVPSTPPSSPPPQMMKTLSVRIRKERCASVQGITVIKALPLHLHMSIPLSTYSLFVTLYQFWDSWEAFHVAVMLPKCC